MLHRLSIKLSAPLLIAAPVLAVGLGLSLLWNAQARSAVQELAAASIAQVHRRVADKVDETLSVPVRVTRVNKSLIEQGLLDPADPSAWRATFVEQSRAFDMLSAISWGAADGRTAWVARYPDGKYYWALKAAANDPQITEVLIPAEGQPLVQPVPRSYDFDLTTRPWYKGPAATGEPTWSEPYVWVGGGPGQTTLGISYGVPIERDGSLLGVIDADYSLNDLSGFLASIEIGETGAAVLIGPDGKLLAASNPAQVLNENDERAEPTAVTLPGIAEAAADLAGLLQARETDLDIDGETYLARAQRVGHSIGLDWVLLTVVPERDFTAEVESAMVRSWSIAILAVTAALGLGLWAARWLARPLVLLCQSVRRIGAGDLDTEVTLHHAPEYTALSDELNTMTHDLRDRLRMRESLHLAMEIQKNLLPSAPPDVRGLDIAGHSTYCDETGGDYYDFLEITDDNEGHAVIALGDVMGHGVAAAMLMATARGILRSRAAEEGSLADFLAHLNNMLVPDTKGERFMTMLLVTLEASKGTLRWASAGHGPPIIYKHATDTFPAPEGGGLPLGLYAGADYEEHDAPRLEPGDIVIVATDGLWEAKNADNELYGMDRLHQLIRDNAREPAEQIARAFQEAIDAHRGETAPDDDLTFVIAKFTARPGANNANDETRF